MLRGHWRIVIAACGVALLGATLPPDEREQPKQAQAEKTQQTEGAPPPVSQPPVQQADASQSYQSPCQEGVDNRDSDLCAQWKAADAAQQSANWTGIGVIVGALTLAAASVAAWYAREAARHTEIGAVQAERSADAGEAAITVTRETGQAQVRGYLFVEYLKGSVSKSRISIDAKVRCVGQSPIRSVEMRCVIRVGFKDGEATYSDFGREGRMITVLRGVDIAPGDGDFVSRKYEISQFESENLDAIVAVGGNAVIQPLIILSYEDVFGHTIFERQKWSSSAGFGSRLRSIEFAFDGSEGITIDEMPKIT